jgi:hypothetical protein
LLPIQIGVADDAMSFFKRELAGDDGGATALTVFQYFRQVFLVFRI